MSHAATTEAELNRLLKDARGVTRDAIKEAISYVQCGLSIPNEIKSLVSSAYNFNQNRYGK